MSAALLALALDLVFVVSGRVEYRDKEWDFNGWTGSDPTLPVRRADVVVLDVSTEEVLGRGVTGSDGSFAVSCAADGPVDVQARIDASTSLHKKLVGPFQSLRVQTSEGHVWSVESPVVAGHDPSQDLDLGTTTALPVLVGANEGQPFNLFDLAVSAFEVLGAPPRGTLKVAWPSYSGSYAWGKKAFLAHDDGYDDAVALHEIGHLVHNLWSDSDNPGGIHYFGDSDQDPRLSFGEGYASFFGASVLAALGRPGLYVDCDAKLQVGGAQLRLRLEDAAPFFGGAQGAADEIAVACALYDLVDEAGLADGMAGDDDAFDGGLLVGGLSPAQAWWEVFTGPVRKARRLTINHAWDGWFSKHGEAGHQPELAEIFDVYGLRFWNDAAEPDDTSDEAQPLLAGAWSAEHTIYSTPAGTVGPGTGDRDWFALELLAGQTLSVETRYPGGVGDARTQADTWISVHRPDGHRAASDDDTGVGRNAAVLDLAVDESGTWKVMVRSRNPTARYGRYEVRALVTGP